MRRAPGAATCAMLWAYACGVRRDHVEQPPSISRVKSPPTSRSCSSVTSPWTNRTFSGCVEPYVVTARPRIGSFRRRSFPIRVRPERARCDRDPTRGRGHARVPGRPVPRQAQLAGDQARPRVGAGSNLYARPDLKKMPAAARRTEFWGLIPLSLRRRLVCGPRRTPPGCARCRGR